MYYDSGEVMESTLNNIWWCLHEYRSMNMDGKKH